ncbi:hypothetical protein Pcar_2485 [Syntrophotalea carbinolica DSM 2380]|uniref:Uncharacterized protein n=1 Tax=Syntrophotalea carbinolica (strain DSM 2380 / NBRC 103641 / GraBd1) TaxID=338963 RepID=Q3A1N3_SYNC1|nr:hypothetical protein [Syntrophotalea carbinolica]ABA89724.1 hypothetical protein Pcar_2485 [Syntrophotalea carbinolica DSM 2380]
MEREDRRRGPDIRVRSLRYLALAGWTALIICFFIFGRAKPQVETFFDRYYDIHLRLYWDTAWLRPLLWLLVAGLVVSLAGLLVNSRRHRRRSDEWRVSLVLPALCCIAGILAFLWAF